MSEVQKHRRIGYTRGKQCARRRALLFALCITLGIPVLPKTTVQADETEEYTPASAEDFWRR